MNKSTTIIFLLLMCISFTSIAGDSLYVWAPNGLNIRTTPSTKSKVLESIPFGTGLYEIESTDISYNTNAIAPHKSKYQNTQAYIIRGEWTKVSTTNGVIGYVVNNYLLPYEPTNIIKRHQLPLDSLGIDSSYSYYYKEVKMTLSNSVLYEYNIHFFELSGSNYTEREYHFLNMDIKDAYLIWSASFQGDTDHFVVTKNWKTLLIIDFSICHVTFKKEDNNVIMQITCAC